MHDTFPLFKILIVLAVIAYQGFQVLRKKGKKADTNASPPVERPEVQEPDFRARSQEDDAALERVRALMHASSTQAPPPQMAAMSSVSAAQSVAPVGPSLWDPRTTATLPNLRDLVLAQVILSQPPGLRPGRQTGRSPLELRR
jgi:hypothetical protein